MPPRRVVVARSPEGKVTTINVRLGEKGVPYGWEYITCQTADVPKTNKLEEHWGRLAVGKKIQTSTKNKERREAFEYDRHIQITDRHKQHIFAQRYNMLKHLDTEHLKALEPPVDHDKIKAVVRFKKDLRELRPDIKSFATNEEYLTYSPEIFTHTLEDYMPLKRSKLLPSIGIFIIIVLLIIPTLLIII